MIRALVPVAVALAVAAIALAGPTPISGHAVVVCASPAGELFNPCATLDPGQAQDRRNAPCEWSATADQWVSVPCHYRDATLDLTIERQP